MKKNTALFKVITTSIALLCNSAFSEESAPTDTDATEGNNAPTEERSTDYVTPQPQSDRIQALEDALISKGLNHQIARLEADGESFLTLHRPANTAATQGCVILLHSDNQHPNWPDAIGPLRNALPNYGWCTLSVELPDIINRVSVTEIASSEAADDNTVDNNEAIDNGTANNESENNLEEGRFPHEEVIFSRISAVIEKTREENAEELIFLGYKTGAAYALKYLAENSDSAKGVIFIDIEAPSGVTQYDLAQHIKQLSQPTLDYYIESQNRNPRFIEWRKQASVQREEVQGNYVLLSAIPDNGVGDKRTQKLIQRVRGFLKQNTKQIDQRKSLPEYKKGLFYHNPVGS